MKNFILKKLLVLVVTLTPFMGSGQKATPAKDKYTGYLFAYFTGNQKSEEAICFAISNDGYHFRALNGNNPVISSQAISSTGGVRDPHILRGQEGNYYMVATDMVSAKGWDSNRAMVLLKSKDLVNWNSSIINIQDRFPGNDSLKRVWAPQTIYDKASGKYMIYWSMKHGNGPDKIYYAYANGAFTDIEAEPKQLFFSPTNGSCIDGDIVYHDGLYHLFFKTEGQGNGIKIAVSPTLTSGYVLQDKYIQQTSDPVEGAGVFKLNNSDAWILMYDVYTKGRYQFTKTTDFKNFKVVDEEVSMNFHPRHGTIIQLTSKETERLVSKWGKSEDFLSYPVSPSIKVININTDTVNKKVYLPLLPNANVASFDPLFPKYPGVKISPQGLQDFSKGGINYTVQINGKQAQTWNVIASQPHNPSIAGYYADPDIMHSEKTGKYYIYPTSDGFNNWSGTYFKTFSSPDLVNWKDEGKIVELGKDVSWANRNAWAPCIIEKKTGNGYKYYFYFTAAQKIGVAVADAPAGPFVDLGKPLVDHFPEGINKGQQIDPEVFHDPQTGKSYLYWGNMYMACAELNEDMVSIKPGTTKIITPDTSFREGTTVFYRNNTYYFLWSVDDTRSENYHVRYGTSTSPLGPINFSSNNIVLEKNPAEGIYGTGHNAVVQVPGTDEWYIVYHRFNYPKGITMGHAAGFNREVCIEKLEFNDDGTIKKVIPTHNGINPLFNGKN